MYGDCLTDGLKRKDPKLEFFVDKALLINGGCLWVTVGVGKAQRIAERSRFLNRCCLEVGGI